MMIIINCNGENILSLSDFSDLSQVIIAIVNLFLAYYVLRYQISKDKKIDNETARLNEQNIKLQWFKELIIQPNVEKINLFYSNLHSIRDKITSNDLTDDEKQRINEFVKAELSTIRKSFVDMLQSVDKNFADKVLENLDSLIDDITNSIFNDELKLHNVAVYEKNIGSKISYSNNKLIGDIYNYKN